MTDPASVHMQAISVLKGMNWSFQRSECFACLTLVMDHQLPPHSTTFSNHGMYAHFIGVLYNTYNYTSVTVNFDSHLFGGLMDDFSDSL